VLRIDPVVAPVRRWRGWAVIRRSTVWQALVRGPVRRVRLMWAAGRLLWQRSLQLRVVSITLILSSLLVASFGVLVVNLITAGLLRDLEDGTVKMVNKGNQFAANQMRFDSPSDPGIATTVQQVVSTSQTDVAGFGAEVQVALTPMRATANLAELALPDTRTLDVVKAPTLSRLRAGMAEGDVMRQLVTVNPDGVGARPFLVYGTLIVTEAGDFGLYYLFPLDRQQGNASLVSTTVAATGTTLVVLLAVLAALVTRMVTRPVKLAARTAQRLSAGLLDQRMEVRGEDELARLATSFNQMAANLQRQIMRLEDMSRLQRRFTSDVSHELRTPLTTVRMAADLIFSSREDFDPAVSRSAELLHAELDRFEELLTDLLEISRFDAGFAVLDAEPIDLRSVVRSVVERFDSLAARTGTELVVEVPEQGVIVDIDQRRFERILRNLVGNAIEHGEGRAVTVRLATDGHAAAVAVRDRGIGLKPGEEKLVFNRFWRADPSRARQTGGTGLGLSISLEDARLHGGWLEAWGAPGQGAQFRLTVPLRAGDRLVGAPLGLVPDDAKLPGEHARAEASPRSTASAIGREGAP
jgi:two-component system, OmpR family, sensor histidine kinase MtrB